MRKNSWNDGVEGTNCPIAPGKNWTYSFQMKDQIGSFFYFPSFGFQKAAGGYGPIRINNREIILIPFDQPEGDFDVLIGDWYNADYKVVFFFPLMSRNTSFLFLFHFHVWKFLICLFNLVIRSWGVHLMMDLSCLLLMEFLSMACHSIKQTSPSNQVNLNF